MNDKRELAFRYTVRLLGADLTPLAAAQAAWGPRDLRILNISEGGMALLFEQAPKLGVGDLVDLSVILREVAFPVKCDVRGINGERVHCAFVEPSPQFQGALKSYLTPKSHGIALKESVELRNLPEALALVDEAKHYRAFLAPNRCGVFLWTEADGHLLRLMAAHGPALMAWTRAEGLRTGRWEGDPSVLESLELDEAGLQWERQPSDLVKNLFADILLAWLPGQEGQVFVERLLAPATLPVPVEACPLFRPDMLP